MTKIFRLSQDNLKEKVIAMKARSALIKLFIKSAGSNRHISDAQFAKMIFFIAFGRLPNLKNPKTFNEHICAIRLSDKCYDYAQYTDKAAVREYVAKTVGEKYLNEIVGIYKSPRDISFDSLPTAFAVKCTHSSGYNIIASDKQKLDWKKSVEKLNYWLSKNYYYVNRERNYKNIEPQILIDKYIKFNGCLLEYKVFCFNGCAEFISVNVFEGNKRRVGVYDTEWNYIPVNMGYKSTGDCIPKPDNFSEMIQVAEKLASIFDFVRVDLYNDGKKIIFSELTFTSGGGLVRIWPKKYDLQWGSFFEDKKQ